MDAAAPAYNEKSWLDRLMNLVAEVHGGESLTAVLLAFNVFLLLGAYYIIKPVREALILDPHGAGAQVKSYMGAVQAVLFLVIVPAYSRLASRVNRIKLITVLFLIFASNLLIFYLLSKTNLSIFWLGIAFFLWIGIFNVMMVAQFWSFANDIYTPEQGKRLFAIVGIGSTVGAVAGAKAADFLVKQIGVYNMMLVSALILLFCLMLSNLIHQREKNKPAATEPKKYADEPIVGKGGFKLILQERYLLLIGLLVLTTNWVNSNGEFIMGQTVSNWAKQTAGADGAKQMIGQFYANFNFWQNLTGALMQLFLVSRILKYLGVRVALFIMPVISITGYTMLAAFPILSYIRIVKIAENSTDYSLQNTVRHALFLPTSRDAKYKGKQATDTFFWRGGDMLSALAVFVGAGVLHVAVQRFAVFNIILVIVWILLAAAIGREHRKRTVAAEPATPIT